MFEKLENLQGRAVTDCFGSGRDPSEQVRPPEQARPAKPAIPTSAKLVAFQLLNAEATTVSERKLFALVDAVACLLIHDGRGGGEETARLAFETVVDPSAALATVRMLTRGEAMT